MNRLRVTLLFASSLWLLLGVLLHAGPVSPGDLQKLSAHPRLFATSEDWQRLRAQVESDPVSRQLFQVVLLRADNALKAPPVVYEKQGRRLLRALTAGHARILSLAMAARLTGKAAYLHGAKREMLAMAKLPNWNPSHFLDTAEGTMALAIGYDWLYNDLSESERTTIREAILEKGLKVSVKTVGWVNKTNNWSQVCHASMAVGALSIAPDEPELGARIINRSLEKIPNAAKEYAPDGAYVEGPGYWSYGTTLHVMLIDALSSTLGSTYGMEKFPGFLESADFMIQTQGPTGYCFNYSDSVKGRGFDAAMFWFARERGKPALVAPDLASLPKLLDSLKEVDKGFGARHFPLALLWWKPAKVEPDAELPLRWSARGGNPLAVQRSSWSDPNAAYIAIKAGKPATSHGHMDEGSFILECDGVRWAEDLGSQDYGGLEADKVDLWNFKQDSERWKVFRLGPEAHNILRFDHSFQKVDGFADIVASRDTDNGWQTLVDLSAVYPGSVSRAMRGVKLAKDRTIWIQDEWTAKDAPVEAAFQWITRAKVTVEKTSLTLHEEGKTLRVRVVEPAGAKITVEDVSEPKASYDAPNPGVSRIVIRTQTPAKATGRFAVLVTPGEAETASPGVGTTVTPLDSWK